MPTTKGESESEILFFQNHSVNVKHLLKHLMSAESVWV